jgi:murein DD-endopeptidase MepM/ murein hydrolase activator NlpD
MRAALLLLILAAGPANAQAALETDPATPVRGTVVRLRVTPTIADLVSRVEGEAAGEPLHLRSHDGIIWQGLLPVPIDGGDSLAIRLVLEHAGGSDTILTAIGVSRGEYRREELRVAPSMAEPDSAARIRIARDNAAARQVSRAAHGTARLWSEPFQRPRPTRVTSGYGTARVFNGTVTSRHLGTDFAGAIGAPVYAANAGRVALVADFYLAGTVVYLDHGEGLISGYFHLHRARVASGDLVTRGQRIGDVGQSGRVTGPHLHWVTRYGGVSVDPMSVLALSPE